MFNVQCSSFSYISWAFRVSLFSLAQKFCIILWGGDNSKYSAWARFNP